MADGTKLERALAAAADDIAAEGKRFALVGGLAVSVRAEVRFTRDVDLAVAVDNDTEAESLVYALKSRGYTTVASVEDCESEAREIACAAVPLTDLAAARRLNALGTDLFEGAEVRRAAAGRGICGSD